ncbi:N-6 DNA methylase [Clostridium botulinum D/C]|uniref:N-6 DNA methylase n=1 Tax=Clostridium botulinum TaxID=1491 RepID=UPI001E343F0A|nr:N-6 DNA methylase [Clostridium botulinum]MCD3319503.1 N-6 DNA methylase [Clostridium botulinum D/C]MCD3324368.1 N-6 DNA methylase [Clostridium botulinum D/C]MCD3327369.1 N-6 DNA methylase [Clostridium botulinum D/C]
MKYTYKKEVIPQDKRAEINEKILYLINNNLCDKYGITQNDVYNSYTGDGGLHGLNFKDYDSFHSFTKAKQQIENGQFFTPPELAKYLVDILKPTEHDLILDLTCGHGSFFNFLPNEFNVYGNELDMKAYKVAKYLYPNSILTQGDMREYNPRIKFDFVIGNPPFNLNLHYNGRNLLSQMIYIQKSLDLLKTGGILALIVPNSFLNDDFSNKSDIEYMDTNFNFICQIGLNNKEFEYLGVNSFATKIIIFQKKSEHLQDKKYNLEMLDKIEADTIYKKYLLPIYQEKENLKNKIFLENANLDSEDLDKAFQDKIKKLLFDIKRTKSISNKYAECKLYLDKYYNQSKPDSMDYREWQKIRITKEKVIKYFKNTLSNQHIKETNKVELIKWNYGLKLKGYSEKNRLYIKSLKTNCMSFNDMIVNNNYPFEDKKYYKLYIKKKKEYENQSKSFENMQEDESIKKWLDNTFLYDTENSEKIYLNEKQLIDTNKSLQKRYSYLQWEQGGGKTITGTFQAKYRLKYNNVANIFVVAPAIAIKNTWNDMLKNFDLNYITINNLTDINNIKQGQFALITFNMLIKYQKFIKKYIKINNKNCMLILDEADGISNINSKRAKATVNCFRKIKYKLLLSGTSTRNSINEIFPQLELMYNNSINMLSEVQYIYTVDKKTQELKEENNKFYLRPIPANKKGYELFSQSHIPKKISVFGVAKYNQNIFNKDILKKIINKTIITRTLEDIAGRKLYNINQIVCNFTDSEKELYLKILEDFYNMSSEYHIHTGNIKKDSLFKILSQLNTLLKACSIPHSFKEYAGCEISSKFIKVFQLLDKFKNERVAIGCLRIKSVDLYATEIKKHFPDRKLFIVTGNTTTMKQRRQIVTQLKKYPNAILLSTQQSLSCSMNIGFVDKVIIPEMNWNDSSMGQYRGRFIRMNSDNLTEVYNVLYDGSIENNLLKLVMCKEKLNLFMKNNDLEDDELFEKYGINSWLFNKLMVKEKDGDGHVNITWGEQEIN